MGKWKYFTDEESTGLTDDLCQKRDRLREFYGFAVIQTCGIRTIEQAIIDGCPHSAHVTGHAIDVKTPLDSAMRERMMWAAGLAGFKRAETCPRHMHFDVDNTKPTPCFWQGEDH